MGIEVWHRITITGSRSRSAVYFGQIILAIRKRIGIFFYAGLICGKILFKLILYIFRYHFSILSDRIYVMSSTPEISRTILIFQICMPNKDHKLLCPLRYPINCDTLICGGILTSICMLSEYTAVYMISTPFARTFFSGFHLCLLSTTHIFFFYTWARRLCYSDICFAVGCDSYLVIFSFLNLILFCNTTPKHLHSTWRFFN